MRIERSGMRDLRRPPGVDDQAQADGQVDAPLDRPPRRQQRLVDAQRRAPDAARGPAGPVLRPPAEDAEGVEGVQTLDLEAGVLDERAQALAGVAAVVAVR